MRQLKAAIIAASLLGLVLLASGCVFSVYDVNVNADRSGTVTVTVTMNESNFLLANFWTEGNTTIAKPVSQYIGEKYFPGFQRSHYNTTSGGILYINLVYTNNAANLDDVQYIDLTVSGSELVFQDQRFVGMCDLIVSEPACTNCLQCEKTNVEYKLHMPSSITTSNSDTTSGTLAIWSFTLDERQNVNARCNLPPSPTTTTSPAPAMLAAAAALGAAAVLLASKRR